MEYVPITSPTKELKELEELYEFINTIDSPEYNDIFETMTKDKDKEKIQYNKINYEEIKIPKFRKQGEYGPKKRIKP